MTNQQARSNQEKNAMTYTDHDRLLDRSHQHHVNVVRSQAADLAELLTLERHLHLDAVVVGSVTRTVLALMVVSKQMQMANDRSFRRVVELTGEAGEAEEAEEVP